jgi:hypothetical protein
MIQASMDEGATREKALQDLGITEADLDQLSKPGTGSKVSPGKKAAKA